MYETLQLQFQIFTWPQKKGTHGFLFGLVVVELLVADLGIA